ncbi:alpha/beta fold hydrolase [Francisella sp. SYW-9]|uniref:alpha/beta fold hydrolase n=1 Tax=Francisella sp. SYW-9 TaxID=2610888 RepID=UPI00123CFD94|nr:alpha/beta hydrolase [Francisella sp. SYW-9]
MKRIICLWLAFILSLTTVYASTHQWLKLPPTPTLPKAEKSGYANVNGIRLWYAEFGKGKPVIMLHGGVGNSNYWGNQVRALEKHYKVIVIDSRGQGRSTNDGSLITYKLMASDVIAFMNSINLKKAAIVGWSDGANTGLELAINYPNRVSRLFAFAANSNPKAIKDYAKSPVFSKYVARSQIEYEKLSLTPNGYDNLLKEIANMWATKPNLTKKQLNSIKVPVWIVDSQDEEAIKRENTLYMADEISNAGLLILPDVSHFAFLQNPKLFNDCLLDFLSAKREAIS